MAVIQCTLLSLNPNFPSQAELSVRAMADRLRHELVKTALNLGAEFVLYGVGGLNLVREARPLLSRALRWPERLDDLPPGHRVSLMTYRLA
jgi:hypothetical protein